MAWIRLVPDDEASGPLQAHYDAAIRRAGKVWGIVRAMSPNPAVLEASMGLYRAIMLGESPLTRAQREMIAVVVSRGTGCHY